MSKYTEKNQKFEYYKNVLGVILAVLFILCMLTFN